MSNLLCYSKRPLLLISSLLFFFEDFPTLWVLDVIYRIRTIPIRDCFKNWVRYVFLFTDLIKCHHYLKKTENKIQVFSKFMFGEAISLETSLQTCYLESTCLHKVSLALLGYSMDAQPTKATKGWVQVYVVNFYLTQLPYSECCPTETFTRATCLGPHPEGLNFSEIWDHEDQLSSCYNQTATIHQSLSLPEDDWEGPPYTT